MIYRRLLILLFTMAFILPVGVQAAFPVRVKAKTETAVAAKPSSGKHLYPKIAERAREIFHLPTPRGQYYEGGGAGLSIVSFVASLLGIVMIPAALIGLAAGSGAVALIILGMLLVIGGLVTGILALAKRQRLKGLAIAGIVLSAYGMIYVIGILAFLFSLF